MTTIATTTATFTAPVLSLDITGKGKTARVMAFCSISALSFIESQSRSDSIANLKVALGTAPSTDLLAMAQQEWTIGRVADRLPVSEYPKGADENTRLEFARKLVTLFIAPAAEGAKARKLPKGKTGRRTVVQHKVCRAADEAWSQVKAELGLGGAQTQTERKSAAKAKRSTNANPVRGDGKGDAKGATKPEHKELVQPTAPVTSDDYVQHMQTQLSSLMGYDQRNAKKRPTTHGEFAELLGKLRQVANAAANKYEERKAAALESARKNTRVS